MATYVKWADAIVDDSGIVIPSVTVTVKDPDTGAALAIYSDRAGTTKSNPFTTGADGMAEFYVDVDTNPRIKIELSKTDYDFTAANDMLDDVYLGTVGNQSPWTQNIDAAGYDLSDLGKLNFDDATTLAVSSGVITITQSYHYVDTEGGAASDDLDTINGGTAGDILYLRAADSSRTVVIKHGAGNIVTPNGNDYNLDNTDKVVVLIFDGTSWHLVGAETGLTAVEDDSSPKLGGNLDAAGNSISNLGSLNYKHVVGDTIVRTLSIVGVQGTKQTETIYVDGASGSDSNDGSAGAPLATIQKALEILPAHIDHDIYIAVNGPTLTYSGTLDFSGLDITARLYIVARDASGNDLFDYGQATSGDTSTLTDSSKSWATNQFANCTVFIVRGTGAGQSRTISSNTATELTVSAAWDTVPDSTSHYMIFGPTISASSGNVIRGIGINNVTVQGFKIECSGEETVFLQAANAWEFVACRFENTSTSRSVNVYVQANSRVAFQSCSFKADSGSNDIALAVREMSSAWIKTCFFEATTTGAGRGLMVYRNSFASFETPRSYFKNLEYGVYASSGGIVLKGSVCTYSGCTTDYSPSGASDPCYIS